MKYIIAIVRPEKLPDVKKALWNEKVYRMTVTDVRGAGEQKGYPIEFRGLIEEVNLLRKVKIEIAVNDSFVDSTIKAIIKGARTGNIGDGKIFVLPLEDCIRIRTEKSGIEAIGGESLELKKIIKK